MRYRKRPVVIEAVECDLALRAAASAWRDLPVWLAAAYEQGDIIFASDHILIITLEGVMRADKTDLIIRGVQGEIYPCKRNIFEATYEPVED